MERAKGPAWVLFSIALIGLGLLTAIFAVDLALLPQWPSVYQESLASRLSADYSAAPVDVAYLAPIGEGFIEDLLAEEAHNAVYLSDAPPVFASGPAVSTPELTPPEPGANPPVPATQPSDPSNPTRTPSSSGSPTPTGTPLVSPTPTGVSVASPTPTGVSAASPTPTGTPLVSPTPTGVSVASPTPTAAGTEPPEPTNTPIPPTPIPPTPIPPTPVPPTVPPTDVVVITRANYQSVKNELDLCATSDGGYDPSVTLTASPGGVMTRQGETYHIRFTLPGECPCTVTVTSSRGGWATVTVGP